VNPDLLGGVGVTGNGGYTKFNGLQLELRKRLSHGLQFQTSYAYGRGYESVRYSFRTPRRTRLDAGTEGGVTHAFKANWVYELPFGQGRRFASNVGPMLDRLMGGWSLDGIARIQSGRLLDFGNVRLVGMSREELQDAFKLRFDDANKAVYMLPQDIIDNTVRAWNVDATSRDGIQRARTANGPLHRAGQRIGLHRNVPGLRRLRRAHPRGHRAETRALRPQHHQADPHQGAGERGVPSRDAECLQYAVVRSRHRRRR
jgi:hypothetical protein